MSRDSSEATPPPEESSVGSFVAGKVLVVDDEKHIARFLEFVLKKAGYTVLIEHFGGSVVDIVREERPQALVLDLMLPDLSGYEVLERISEANLRSNISILVLTASPGEGAANKALKESVDSLCLKPIAPSALVSTLKDLGVYPPSERKNRG
ncbi:MAG: response regulator [Acidobacteriota bacterium]|nr:MAG: response regulator [Acidobacteriota bacterium]